MVLAAHNHIFDDLFAKRVLFSFHSYQQLQRLEGLVPANLVHLAVIFVHFEQLGGWHAHDQVASISKQVEDLRVGEVTDPHGKVVGRHRILEDLIAAFAFVAIVFIEDLFLA